MKFLRTANLKKYHGRVCLLRVDLNIEPGQEESAYRLQAILPTVKLLLKNKIRIVIVSHRGRPRRKESKYSLRPLLKTLEKKIGQKIVFLTSTDNFRNFEKNIKSSKNRVFLLENLRFWPGEGENSPVFAQKLAILGDFYVNEAFAVSHRKNASVSLLPRFLPHYAGLSLESEMKNLDRVMRGYKHPLTLIIGGAKAVDKLGVIEYFLSKASWILLGGGPANTFFKALGLDIGDSIFDAEAVSLVKKYLNNPKIILPDDLKISRNKILDIGERTTDKFIKLLDRSKTIIWNGPVGLFEEKGFGKGSYRLATAVAKNRGFTLVGGGETTTIILKLGLEKKIKFVSTGGGAMLDYLSGKKLPGIEALK